MRKPRRRAILRTQGYSHKQIRQVMEVHKYVVEEARAATRQKYFGHSPVNYIHIKMTI